MEAGVLLIVVPSGPGSSRAPRGAGLQSYKWGCAPQPGPSAPGPHLRLTSGDRMARRLPSSSAPGIQHSSLMVEAEGETEARGP